MFVPWLDAALETVQEGRVSYLTVRRHVAERQWNIFISWMMGVCGTRRVLDEEQYSFIAPLSAFYTETEECVDLSRWHQDYPPARLTASKPPCSTIRDRPDYVAIRPAPNGGAHEFAIVEAKGTSDALTNRHECSPLWMQQAYNAVLYYDNETLPVQRRMVVATRYNPRARRPRTRRIEIRAWNEYRDSSSGIWSKAVVDVLMVATFGICYNLGLSSTASALREASRIWQTGGLRPSRLLSSLNRRADIELTERLTWESADWPTRVATRWFLVEPGMHVVVGLAEELLSLIDSLRRLEHVSTIYDKLLVVEKVTAEVEEWNSTSLILGGPITSRNGVSVKLLRIGGGPVTG